MKDQFLDNKLIHEFFEQQVLLHGNESALVLEGREITYTKLNEKANQLARYFREACLVKPDDLIALCLKRSEFTIVAILAVLKAGAGYIPLDPSYPKNRIEHILEETQASIFLFDTPYSDAMTNPDSFGGCKKINVDAILPTIDLYSSSNLSLYINSSSLAYVIYTSGTTGAPKGVMIEHRSVVNLVKKGASLFDVNERERPKDRIHQFIWYSNYVFDAHVWEIFTPLLNGHTLHIIKDEQRYDMALLSEYIEENKITIALLPPSILTSKHIFKLKILVLGGEKTSKEQLSFYQREDVKIFNAYGPTENTVISTVFTPFDENHSNYIGKPIPNVGTFVLDSKLNLVREGEVGELYLTGIGLARGYLNQDILTKASFIVNPFKKEEKIETIKTNNLLYKTGDLVKLLPDGNLEYVGRNDRQIKIRGHRIEIDEVEEVLSSYPGIMKGIVNLKKSSGLANSYLIGYYTSVHPNIRKQDIMNFLLSRLPNYMVPRGLIELKEFPLNLSGKIDLNALPDLPIENSKEQLIPRNLIEQKVLAIMSEVLGLQSKDIGILDDFFEIGGNSILAIRLVSRLSEEFNKKLSTKVIFSNRTIENIAKNINQNNEEELVIVPAFLESKKYPLSFAQERLYFTHLYSNSNSAYNIQILFKINSSEDFDLESIKSSFNLIMTRHEILRTFIKKEKEDEFYQEICEDRKQFSIVRFTETETLQQAVELIEEEVRYVFDFSKEFPIRVLVIKEKEGCYVNIMIHHIAFDGWSQLLFLKELDEVYGNFLNNRDNNYVKPLIQYKDFAVSQRNYLKNGKLKSQLGFWKSKLEGYEGLNLPIDKPRPLQFNYRGKDKCFTINAKLSQLLKSLAKELKVSINNLLLTGYYLMLRSFSNQNDLVVGVPFSNRHYKQIENLLGFFVNSLPIRIQIDSSFLIKDLIKIVNQEIIEAQEYQDLPFERLIRQLKLSNDPSSHPVFGVMFTIIESELTYKAKHFEKYDLGKDFSQTAKFDLTAIINVAKAEFSGVFNYATDVFTETTILNFIKTYTLILEQFCNLVSNPEKQKLMKVSEIYYLNKKDYKKIIVNWNKTNRKIYDEKIVSFLFEKRVDLQPDAVAVIDQKKRLTYYEINKKANQLAHYLTMEKSAFPGAVIALLMGPSDSFLIAILAILKIGGTFLPLDQTMRQDRLNYIIQDARPSVILTQGKLEHKLPENIKAACFEEIELSISEYPTCNLNLEINSNLPAYIIYTSGTTGEPKGVVVCHKSLLNYIFNVDFHLSFSSQEKVDFSTNPAVDLTLTMTIVSLCLGSQICVYRGDRLDLKSYCKHLIENEIKTIKLVPSYFNLLLGFIPSNALSKVIVGGEKLQLTPILKEEISRGSFTLFDEYGPTETTVGACLAKITLDENLNIGKPYFNVQVYILNQDLKPVPLGAIGEIYIGGDSLASSYLNDPLLTDRKFISNPFTNDKTRIYKTGDLGRWLPDGKLVYCGRVDQQIKLRGHRIELEEIEHLLSEYPGIRECSVALREKQNGLPILCGYYVSSDGNEIDKEKIKQHLASYLPDYMIPIQWISLPCFPRLASGKVDKKNLPFPSFKSSVVFPSNQLEEKIRGLWGEILNIETNEISVEDNFFDLGGNSLIILKVIKKIENLFGEGIVHVVDLFKYPSIRTLANYLSVAIADNSFTGEKFLGDLLEDKGIINHKKREDPSRVTKQNLEDPFSSKNSKPICIGDIAVIGLSCAYSGSKNLGEFWGNILSGKETLKRLTKEECRLLEIPESKLNQESFLGVGGVVDDIDHFDPEFWGMSQRDAEILDPQIRKFLEHAYHALEHAGSIQERKIKKIGVFAGMGNCRYHEIGFNRNKGLSLELSEWEKQEIADPYLLSTKASYHLNLTGISLNINTACSTSLVTIIEASKNLSLGVCDLALAGGVSLTIPENFGDIAEDGMIFSKDGHCRPFDINTNGVVRGSGVGVVVLKRLDEAIEDKDNIFAVIKGYATNNDGKRKVGFTAPSPEGQKECISRALQSARISPSSIGYIECHGTGTPLGDPIEVSALREIFDQDSRPILGSVKANIGHADVASGVAGFIKACLIIKNKTIPPQINFSEPNISIKGSSFKIVTERQKWDTAANALRYAGVSSFGIGGTNAHIILEEYKPEHYINNLKGGELEKEGPPSYYLKQMTVDQSKEVSKEKNFEFELMKTIIDPSSLFGINQPNKVVENYLIPVSANNTESLKNYCVVLHDFLKKSNEINLKEIAYAMQRFREHFLIRKAFVCQTKNQLMEELLVNSRSPDCSGWFDITTQANTSSLVVIFGDGKIFNRSLINHLYCAEPVFRENIDLCFQLISSDNELSKCDVSEIEHLGKFIESYSMAKLFEYYGLKPLHWFGKGIQEYILGALSGVFDLKVAFQIIIKIKKYNFSSDKNNQSNEILDCKTDLEKFLSNFKLKNARLKFISNITGQLITEKESTSPNYWGSLFDLPDQPTKIPSFFKESLPGEIYLHFGRRNTKSSLFEKRDLDKLFSSETISDDPLTDEGTNSGYNFYQTIAELWSRGVEILWPIDRECYSKKIASEIPGYPFKKVRCWLYQKSSQSENLNGNIRKKNSYLTEIQSDELEEELGRIFCEVLGCRSLSKNSSYFELGGDSLSALRLAKKISEFFDIKVSSGAIFKYDTISKIKDYLNSLKKKKSELSANYNQGEI